MHLDVPDLERITEAYAVGTEPPLIPSLLWRASQGRGLMSRFKKSQIRVGRAASEQATFEPRMTDLGVVKAMLGAAPHAPLDPSRPEGPSVQAIAQQFFAEVFKALKKRHKQPTDVVFTVPADSFEPYREHLKAIARANGFRGVSFIDEPVAAALGYGLDLSGHRIVVVVDAGRRTTHLVGVRLTPRQTQVGVCEVLAKSSANIGGDLVDRALASALGAQQAESVSDSEQWCDEVLSEVFLDEVRCAKERVAYGERGWLSRTSLQGSDSNDSAVVALDQQRIQQLLDHLGLYDRLDCAIDEIICGLEAMGLAIDDIDDVLLVGGCSLLTGFKATVQAHFPNQRVLHWQPFDASVIGAARFGGQDVDAHDFVSHEYAIALHGGQTSEPRFETVVETGTRIPTSKRHWHMQLSPACVHGRPESYFRLVVYEVAPESRDETSRLEMKARVATTTPRYRVALNEDHPILGELVPPHYPDDLGPRLDVSFSVDKQRRLRISVLDLKTGRLLIDDECVVQTL